MGGGFNARTCSAALLLTTVGLCASTSAVAQEFKILYFEPLAIQGGAPPANSFAKTGSDTLAFEAYGRRFDLVLETNQRLLPAAESATGMPYAGHVAYQNASWVRLTQVGEALHGMIWDGSELYVVEPAATASDHTVAPLAPEAGANVIYRLSDTVVDLGANFCSAADAPADADAPQDGLSTFKTITAELATRQQAAGAAMVLQLSALGDSRLRQRYTSETEARNAVLVRLNNVDGIFSEQVGVEIRITELVLFDDDTDPFSATTSPNSLLSELGNLRSNTPNLRDDGLTHLFTGRNLDGDTVGIAYIDMLCRGRYGVGLTESRGRGETLESLIAAHELGHNFGAVHDGSGECATTSPSLYIMAPQSAIGRNTFSQCSQNAIAQSIQHAACITELPPPDLLPSFAVAPAPLTSGQSFSWSINVINQGGRQAYDAAMELTLPPAIAVESANVVGGSCTTGAGVVSCTLGQLLSSDNRNVDLILKAQTAGVFDVTARTIAGGDANTSNNIAMASLAVDTSTPAPAAAPSPPAPSGGGGGLLGWPWLLALAMIRLAVARRR